LEWDAVFTTTQDVNTPIMGGLVKADNGTIIDFVGINLDAQVNMFTWDIVHGKWMIETSIYHM
jgi:hypothetical protein